MKKYKVQNKRDEGLTLLWASTPGKLFVLSLEYHIFQVDIDKQEDYQQSDKYADDLGYVYEICTKDLRLLKHEEDHGSRVGVKARGSDLEADK